MEEFLRKNYATALLLTVLASAAFFGSRPWPSPAAPAPASASAEPQVVERIVEVVREVPAARHPFPVACPNCRATFTVVPPAGATGGLDRPGKQVPAAPSPPPRK